MKWNARFFLGILLILLLVACNMPTEPEALPPDTSVEDADKEIDYCSELPAGTRMTWFDLSTFIFVPGSSFQMGFDQPEAVDHKPAHQVALGPYWMQETEVSNRAYATCVTVGACSPPETFTDWPYWFEEVEDLDDPVVGVTWEQADAYCGWLGTRLPTEAEWELAARGTGAAAYPWGDADPDCEHANFTGCLDPDPDQPAFTGLLPEGKSAFDMLDMAGNVNEWVADWYGADYYTGSPDANPTGPADGTQRVFRGGGYLTTADLLQSYLRQSLEPDQAQADLGFRCAWSCGGATPPPLCSFPPAVAETIPLGERPATPKPDIHGEGWCEWRRDTQVAGVTISGSDLGMYDFSGGGADCAMQGGVVVCTGGDIVPEGAVTLTVCPDCAPGFYFDQASGFCRAMFALDPDLGFVQPEIGEPCPPGLVLFNGFCIEIISGEDPPEPEDCPPGQVWFPVMGCVDTYNPTGPVIDTVDPPPVPEVVTCPPGHWPSLNCGCIPNGTICLLDGMDPLEVPAGPGEAPEGGLGPVDWWPGWPLSPGEIGKDPGFKLPDEDDCREHSELQCAPFHFPANIDGCWECVPWSFNVPDCPEGFSYDAEAGCCVPDVPVATCPPFTYFDPATHSCIPIVFEGQDCFDITVKIPSCGQKPRPTPEPDPCRGLGFSECTNSRICNWDRANQVCVQNP